jgi:hypothetical protein
MYVLVYVDDLIIVSSSPSATSHLLSQLDSAFTIKYLGSLYYFLGIEVFSSDRGLILSQRRYITEILDKTNMSNCRPDSTPMSSSEKISRHTGTPLCPADVTKFCSTVGALQYLMMTRPDIAFVVNKVCQYMQQATDQHWTAVKHILQYLKFMTGDGL